MADTSKTIKNASNSELNAILYRVRQERDCLQLLREIQATSTPNINNSYPDWEKLGPFSTETIVYEGKTIKQMTDQELSEYLVRLRNENELMNVIQNIQNYNKPSDSRVSLESTPYPGLDLNSPIDNLYHEEVDKTLEHFGIPGMRWGVRKSSGTSTSKGDKKAAKQLAKADKTFAKRSNIRHVAEQSANKLNNIPEFEKSRHTIANKLRKQGLEGETLVNAYQQSLYTVMDKHLKNDPSTYNPSKTARVTFGMVQLESGGVYLTPVMVTVDKSIEHSDTVDIGFTGTFRFLMDGKFVAFEPADKDEPDDLEHSEIIEKTLEHFGIPGMRWGVRKSRGKSSKTAPSEDHSTSRQIKKKKTKEMSNDELKKLTTRMNLERNLRDLKSSDYQKGLNFVKTLTAAGTTVAGLYALSETPLGKKVASSVRSTATAALSLSKKAWL